MRSRVWEVIAAGPAAAPSTRARAVEARRESRYDHQPTQGGTATCHASSAQTTRDPGPLMATTRFVKAERLQKLPPYLFAEIDRKKKAALAAGRDVINLGVGDPDRPTPEPIIRSLQKN